MHRREKNGRKKKCKNSAVSRKGRKGKFLQVSLLKKCKVGVRRDMEKKEKAVFGILVLGKDWRKINVFQVFWGFWNGVLGKETM